MIRPSVDLSCSELVELVTDYLEATLSLDERTRFELHLVYCEPCRTYLAQMRQAVAVAGRLAEAWIGPDVRRELLEVFRAWKRERGGEA